MKKRQTDRLFVEVEKTAFLSPCERYRHSLGRHWDRDAGYVLFIGLNPSTADAEQDDPTIRRCIRFATDWGYGGIEMCNLFDWRATDPREMRRKIAFAVSDKNEPCLRCRVSNAKLVIAAWGKVPWAQTRIREVFEIFRAHETDKRWHCLGFCKSGKTDIESWPRHPLYVRAAQKPVLFW